MSQDHMDRIVAARIYLYKKGQKMSERRLVCARAVEALTARCRLSIKLLRVSLQPHGRTCFTCSDTRWILESSLPPPPHLPQHFSPFSSPSSFFFLFLSYSLFHPFPVFFSLFLPSSPFSSLFLSSSHSFSLYFSFFRIKLLRLSFLFMFSTSLIAPCLIAHSITLLILIIFFIYTIRSRHYNGIRIMTPSV